MTPAAPPGECPDSLLSRWDARWKLTALVVAALAVAALDGLGPSTVALLLGLALVVLARLPQRWTVRRLSLFAVTALPFLLVLPFTLDLEGPGWDVGPVRVSQRGVVAGTAVFCRCLAIGALALVLVGTAPIHHLLAASRRVRVPGVLVLIGGLSYRYAFLLADEMRRVRVALRTRGFRVRAGGHGYRTLAYVAGAVLVRGSDRAERVAAAMRCRGFDGNYRTTCLFRTTIGDIVIGVVIVAVYLALVTWDLFERGIVVF